MIISYRNYLKENFKNMQKMIRNNKGVTLTILVITIITLIIILSITVNYGVGELREITNRRLEAQLGIVQEAVIQRYALVKASNQLGIKAKAIATDAKLATDTGRPSRLVGTRLATSSAILNYGFTDVKLKENYSANEANKTYEEFYYLLDESDMKDLGVEKGISSTTDSNTSEKAISYIVNYSTGEIFDIINKKYYNNEDYIYIQPTDVTMESENYNYNDD